MKLVGQGKPPGWHIVWSPATVSVVHEQDLNKDLGEIGTLSQEIPGFSECGQDDAEARINKDVTDPGYQILSEEEILA